MKGLELSERYYLEYGAPMIRERFAEIEPLIAVGLVGSGSECFGYDDTASQDHDFEPGFCIFLPDENIIDRKTEFALERAYAKLPKEFMGYKRNDVYPVGGRRHGIIRMSSFFKDKTGTSDGELSVSDWFSVSEQSLAEATNGKVFFDGLGRFSEIRQRLAYMPEDIRLKKIAGELIIMGQAGQYNYGRCISRGESAAAQLAAIEFVKSAIHTVFLLNRSYMPYYKWSFRALRDLPILAGLYEPLEYLISSGNTLIEAERKRKTVERICADIVDELKNQSLTDFLEDAAEGHAYSVNDRIGDSNIRNLHILYAL